MAQRRSRLEGSFSHRSLSLQESEQDAGIPELSYFTVRQNIQKYLGRRVAWVGMQASSHRSFGPGSDETTHTYVFLAPDSSGEFLAENPFMFSFTGGWEDRDTAASREKNRMPENIRVRLIFGTVIGTAQFRGVNGNINEIPELADVTIEVVKKEN